MSPLAIALLVVSPFIGSFLGLLAFRLPAHEEVVFTPSHCRSCGHRLGPRDLVPLVSFALSRGHCRYCGAPIAPAYPLIELGAVATAALAVAVSSGWLLVVTCLFGWSLLTLMACDLLSLSLPNAITLPLIPAGLAVAYFLPGDKLIGHAIGAVAGGGVLWASAVLFRLLRGKTGLGMGDVKLFAAAGAWLGWAALPIVMLVAALGTILAVLALNIFGAKIGRHTLLPFGVGLTVAIYAAWLYSLAPLL